MIAANYSINPLQLVKSVKNHLALLIVLVKRDIMMRYKGSALGVLWAILLPLIMLAVYTLVFSIAFNARWGTAENESKVTFALILFAGLIVYNFFSECFNRSPVIVLQNVNYVKKVVFPLEMLPFVILGTALFNAMMSMFIWILGYIVFFGVPHLSILYLPVVLFPLTLFILGISFFLASLGVYIRDIGHVVGVFSTLLMFLSPIFYPLTAIPEKYRFLLHFNPLTPFLGWARDVMFWGKSPDWSLYPLVLLCSIFCLVLGFAWFQKTRKGFADVL